jgi:aspartyl protease family protein
MPPPDIAPGRERQVTYWLLALVALGGLTWFFDGLLEERVNPNRDVGTRVTSSGDTEVVLRQNHHGHYVASGTINDTPVVFLLDTGATDVSVPEHIAGRAGLQPGARFRVSTANGDIEVFRTRITSLQLGGLRLDGVEASINPHMEEDEVLLGMSALRALHMTQADGTLTIRAPGGPT